MYHDEEHPNFLPTLWDLRLSDLKYVCWLDQVEKFLGVWSGDFGYLEEIFGSEPFEFYDMGKEPEEYVRFLIEEKKTGYLY